MAVRTEETFDDDGGINGVEEEFSEGKRKNEPFPSKNSSVISCV